MALVQSGFSLADAWHMSPLDAERYSAIHAAWSIPPDERVGTVAATREDVAAIFGR